MQTSKLKRKLYDNITTKLQLFPTVIDKHVVNTALNCLRVSIHKLYLQANITFT